MRGRSQRTHAKKLLTPQRPPAFIAEPFERRLLMSTNSWKTPIGGNWDDATRWSLGHVPTAAEDVNITVAGNYTVTATGNDAAHNLTLAKPLKINPGARLELFGNLNLTTTLTLAAGPSGA